MILAGRNIRREMLLLQEVPVEGGMRAKLTIAEAEEVRRRRADGEPVKRLATEFRCCVATIHNILNFDGYGMRPGVITPDADVRPLLSRAQSVDPERRLFPITVNFTKAERIRINELCSHLRMPVAHVLILATGLLAKHSGLGEPHRSSCREA